MSLDTLGALGNPYDYGKQRQKRRSGAYLEVSARMLTPKHGVLEHKKHGERPDGDNRALREPSRHSSI